MQYQSLVIFISCSLLFAKVTMPLARVRTQWTYGWDIGLATGKILGVRLLYHSQNESDVHILRLVSYPFYLDPLPSSSSKKGAEIGYGISFNMKPWFPFGSSYFLLYYLLSFYKELTRTCLRDTLMIPAYVITFRVEAPKAFQSQSCMIQCVSGLVQCKVNIQLDKLRHAL